MIHATNTTVILNWFTLFVSAAAPFSRQDNLAFLVNHDTWYGIIRSDCVNVHVRACLPGAGFTQLYIMKSQYIGYI